MIDILNGYEFRRNRENVVTYKISSLATILGLQEHEIKEHYFYCVVDQCFSEGEMHTEEIVDNEIELHLPVYNVQQLIESLVREGFDIDNFQSENIVKYMLETQRIVSECFDLKNGFQNYKDPIRKHGLAFVKEIKESISRNKEEA